jgi:peptidoglycan/LPS O-acetylase OafA/YrhL
MTDRLIRITTALAVAAVAAVAAVISYRHAYELVSTHGETGLTARLVPFTVDGLILAASMLILDANRRGRPVPALAHWCLAAGIVATICANLGARPEPRVGRCPGQRLAGAGTGWFFRAANAAHQGRASG